MDRISLGCFRYKAVIQRCPGIVNIYLSIQDLYLFPGQTDHSLDVKLALIIWILKDHDVKSFRIPEFLCIVMSKEIYIDTIGQAEAKDPVTGS